TSLTKLRRLPTASACAMAGAIHALAPSSAAVMPPHTVARRDLFIMGDRPFPQSASQGADVAPPSPPRLGVSNSRLPLVAMFETSPDFSICSSKRAARL